MLRLDLRTALALLVLVPLLLLGPGLLPGKVIADHGTEQVLPFSALPDQDVGLPQANADIVRENLVYRTILKKSLSQGEIPWWEPSMYGGGPFVAMSHTQALYPPSWLVLPLSPTAAHSWLLWFHLVIAGWGAFAWLRAAGRSQEAALLGGLAFLLNGMFATRHGHPQYVAVGAWLPWLLLGVEHLFGPRRLLAAAGISAATAMMILAGHPSIYVFGSYFIGLYLLWRGLKDRQWRSGFEGFFLFALAYAIGVGLASYQFLAILEFSEFSGRSHRPLSVLQGRLHHWVHAFRLLFPNLSGTMVDGSYWSVGFTHYWAGTLYNGVVPLILGVLAAILAPRKAGYVAAIAVAVLLVLFVPLAFGLVYPLPGFAFGRADRASIAWFLAVAWLAALGLDLVLERAEGEPRSLTGLAVFGGVAGLAAVVSMRFLAASADVEVSEAWTVWTADWAVISGLVLWFAALGLLWSRAHFTRQRLTALLVALMLLDLGPWWREWAVARDADNIFPVTETTDFLQSQPGPFRIAKVGKAPGSKQLYRVFPSNVPAAYGIEEIHGFGPLHIMWLDRLLSVVELGRGSHGWHVRPFKNPGVAHSPVLDMMDVRYIVAKERIPNMPVVLDAELVIHENTDVLGRAWFVRDHRDGTSYMEAATRIAVGATDPREIALIYDPPDLPAAKPSTGTTEVELVSHSRSEIVLRKTGPDAGFAVIAETWYPGWTAEVNGRVEDVLRANVLQRAVVVPPGDSEIVLRYRPTFGSLALGLTLLSALLWLLLLIAGLRSVRRDQ